MIPEFDTLTDNLPPGIYPATIEEFEERFVINNQREMLYEGLKRLMEDLKAIGCKTIYVDGSFVTMKIRPKDIDVCWENTGIDETFAEHAMPILWKTVFPRTEQQAKYHCDVFPARIIMGNFIEFFQKDKKTGEAKGIIELQII